MSAVPSAIALDVMGGDQAPRANIEGALRAAVMETVGNPEELEVELRWLFGDRWS